MDDSKLGWEETTRTDFFLGVTTLKAFVFLVEDNTRNILASPQTSDLNMRIFFGAISDCTHRKYPLVN